MTVPVLRQEQETGFFESEVRRKEVGKWLRVRNDDGSILSSPEEVNRENAESTRRDMQRCGDKNRAECNLRLEVPCSWDTEPEDVPDTVPEMRLTGQRSPAHRLRSPEGPRH